MSMKTDYFQINQNFNVYSQLEPLLTCKGHSGKSLNQQLPPVKLSFPFKSFANLYYEIQAYKNDNFT